MSCITGFRTSVASSSRITLPPISTLTPCSATLTCGFSTTSPAHASRERKKRIKAKLDRNLALRASRAADEASHRPDPVLGHVPRPDGTSPWDTCRLRRTILRPEDVYNAPLTNFAADGQPQHFLPGLSAEDRDILFGALPYAQVDVKSKIMQVVGGRSGTDGDSGSGSNHVDPTTGTTFLALEGNKNEQMLRLLDLRNANKAGIEAMNRQRVIEEFGRKSEGAGLDTGSSEVQAALLTHKIRSLAEHLSANPKDNSNKRSLRSLVHKRQQILKYFARKEPLQYEPLLADLGLERKAVEGEISM